ncbi:Nucleotide-diphospho-sugar transferase [Seminavis robusta]|uniref:Nucleotide-diphospho-sugar transferase n=1 Tax=Seminavis robusta TaxID=568900 RepID=A0A9N8H490_9STRA|nr:Nucleotide-diphospho-sugar transferase [Seminavis robusta]|eukprot:Sro79_g042800.1 Nucleotide-diphospho-sugar transferase (551) ;mRNA; r:83540-85762
MVLLMISNGVSFFLGAFLSLHAFAGHCPSPSSQSGSMSLQSGALRTLRNNEESEKCTNESLFPEGVQRFASGISHVKKEDFTNTFDLGVPIDQPKKGAEDVLILYNKKGAMPKRLQSSSTPMELLKTDEAVEQCDYMNVILTNYDPGRAQCTVIVPQYESYHIQKYMRVPQTGHRELNSKYPLEPVSRGHQSNGIEQFLPPKASDTQKNWDMLRTYLASIDDVLKELRPIVDKISIKNTVVVMVCNHGQSELLLNFACSAKSKNLDISNVLVFATDQETKELAESVGLSAYFDERNFADVPLEAAGRYGDRKFVAMMMAKVICVQVVGLLGVDILFQDVDIVWFKSPLSFFHNEQSPIYSFDAYFQDDGAHSVRYAPWSSNSGFYYLRYNDRTQYFLNSLLMHGDLILKTDSHQQALVAVLSEHANLYGLRVKVLSRDEDDFPGGYHFHQKTGKYMKSYFKGHKKPYLMHMSWTKNKDNKLLFFKQLGEWYLNEQCINRKPDEIHIPKGDDFVSTCCSNTALFSCHYRDKPSIKPCKDSPPIDKGGKSFW